MPNDYTRESCRDFVSALASSAPAPGGGGAAALAGAIGTALGHMVGALTVGKKKYAGVQDEIAALMAECDGLQTALLDQVPADAKGFEPLARAYGIPKDDPDRGRILEEATAVACEAPMRIMALCCRAIDAVAVLAEKGSRLAVSDAGCAAALLEAALLSASLNVLINTKSMKDRAAAGALNARVEQMTAQYAAKAEGIFRAVRAQLTEG